MTKIQMEKYIKELEDVNSDMDDALGDAYEKISDLENHLAYLEGALSSMGGKVRKKFTPPTTDSELCRDKIRLKVKAGATAKDMDAIMKVGNKMAKWLKKNKIELDKGSNEDN